MKSNFILLCLVLATGFNSLFANVGSEVNSSVLRTFQKEFANAERISWSTTGPLAKATFTIGGQEWYAFYSEAGKRVALGRNIHISHLPINLITDVNVTYFQKGYWATAAFEVSKDDESAFYMSVENADEKLLLKSINLSEWMVYKSTTKQ